MSKKAGLIVFPTSLLHQDLAFSGLFFPLIYHGEDPLHIAASYYYYSLLFSLVGWALARGVCAVLRGTLHTYRYNIRKM
jgi:hypothetical protein